jgi:hypothetical protein
MELIHVYKPCTSWSIALVLVHSIIPMLCPLFNSEFIAVKNVHEIFKKKSEMLSELGPYFLAVKLACTT